jgi:hypothetical protein
LKEVCDRIGCTAIYEHQGHADIKITKNTYEKYVYLNMTYASPLFLTLILSKE